MGPTEKPVKERREKKDKSEKKKSKSQYHKETESTATPDDDVPMLDAGEVSVQKEKKEKKDKKEKKEKKEKKTKTEKEESKPTTTDDADSAPASPSSSKKRKRSTDEPELAIDLSLPEPPSKKTLRKLKKAGIDPSTLPNKTPKKAGATLASAGAKVTKVPASSSDSNTGETQITFPTHASQSRSKHGIWIGNLSFHSTDQELRNFFINNGGIPPEEITRINLPLNTATKRNKGFAYVDFTTSSALQSALSLSESLLNARRVLIKDAKDFTTRKSGTATNPAQQAAAALTKKPPSKILYCGNLEFDVTPEMLQSHFSFAGKIAKVRLATFQDSGKCKGFGFIDFEDIESVKRAMLGLSPEEEEIYENVEGKEEVELFKKRRKRAILSGRPITMEFGEDPSTRYKKRFGKKEGEDGGDEERPRRRMERRDGDDGERPRKERRERVDTRSADPGAAYSADSRRTGAITDGMSKGQKVTFD